MKTLPAIALTGVLAFAAGFAVAEFVLPRSSASGAAHSTGGPATTGGSDAAKAAGSGHALPLGPDHLPTDPKGIVDALTGLKEGEDDFEFHAQLYGVIKQTTAANIRAVVEGYIQRGEKGEEHYETTAELFARWATLDPRAAMAGLEMIPGRDTKAMATTDALVGWASIDLDAAHRWVEALPPGEKKIDAERTLIENLAKTDPRRAAELAVQDAQASGGAGGVGEAFGALALQDPQAAAAEALALPAGRIRVIAIAETGRKWAQSDPGAALDFVNAQLDGTFRSTVVNNMIQNWQRRDFDAAFAWVRNRPADAARGQLVQQLATEMAADDPVKALQLVDLVPVQFQDETLRDVASTWARKAPLDAAAWARSQTDPAVAKTVWAGVLSGLDDYPQDAATFALQLPKDQQSSAVEEVINVWSQKDAPAAAAWADRLADPALQGPADREIMDRWVNTDPAAALQWFSKKSDLPNRDGIISSFAETLARTNPNLALQWIGTIQDPDKRTEATVNSASAWMNADRTAASAWIANSSLSDEVKKQLLAR